MYKIYIVDPSGACGDNPANRRFTLKRTQIYLDEQHDRELARRAKATGVTKSELIRRAIDKLLAGPDDADRRLTRFRRAVAAAAGRVPDLPEGRVYVERLRRADIERQREIDSQRGV